MRCAVGREDGQVVEADVSQVGITSGKAGELGVVLEVVDKRILVILVHVGDYALLRCGIGCFGAFVRHAGCARAVVAGVFVRRMRMEQRFGNQVFLEVPRRGVATSCTAVCVGCRGEVSNHIFITHQQASSVCHRLCQGVSSRFTRSCLIQYID